MPRPATTVESVLSRLDRPEGEAGCWVWTGKIGRDGYGHVSVKDRDRIVHRYVYEGINGRLESDLTLDHLCRNRACCNPDHLEPVTMRTNVLRGEGPSAANARKTHCKRGHVLWGENLKFNPDGARQCRTCLRLRDAAFKARRKQRKQEACS